MPYKNLPDMFYQTCAKYTEKTVVRFKDNGQYQSMDYVKARQDVSELAAGLLDLGVNSGDKIAILSETRYEWAFCDYAILSCGAVTVPVYPTLLPEHVRYILNDCEARIVIVANEEGLEKVREVSDKLPHLKKIIMIETHEAEDEKLTRYEDLLKQGRKLLDEKPNLIEERVAGIARKDLATIIYTSGTTGDPKGVMLGHEQLLSNIEATTRAVALSESDTFLSFLPLSHVFERMAGHYLPMYVGAIIAYAESIDTVPENLQEIKPTIMTSVPRLFEKIYAKVLGSVEDGSAVKKKLFYWALDVGREVSTYFQQHKPLPGGLKLKHTLADKLVFSKLRQRVGGNIRFFVSGGAPLSKEVAEFFLAAGLLILEGYGITETSPVIAVNRIEKYKPGSVGLPLDNAEVKIAEDGEILTRGPAVMLGYFKNEAETKDAIDKDGWYHTGDIGHIDSDGMLVITDRKKNIIVTAGGKNIAPQKIENMLTTSRLIEQAVVVGDRRKFCSALIVPSFDDVEKFTQEKGISFSSRKELCQNEQVRQLIQDEIDNVNKELASYEAVKKFVLLEEPFTIESGELTPSMKVKRKEVEINYKEEIDGLYE